MTEEEQTQAIRNLVERVNRIESTVAHNKPIDTDGLEKAIDAAIDLINTAIESHSHSQDISRNGVGMMVAVRIANGR